MHPFLILFAVIALIIGFVLLSTVFRSPSSGVQRAQLCNVGEGEYDGGAATKLTDAAITTRHLLYAFGSDVNHVAVIAAADTIPLGTVPDEASAAELPVEVRLLGVYNGPIKMIAGETIDLGEEVFQNAAGKLQDLPASAGTYYSVGYAMNAASADGVVLVNHHTPRKLIVT